MQSGADTVVLSGPAMVSLVRAVAALGDAGLARYSVVGGVAVSVRLGQAHRATADVDTVVDETTPPDAVTALLALPGTERDPTGGHRVRVRGTKVEILGVGPLGEGDLDGLPPKAALFVAAHSWALETATPVTIISGDDRSVRATAPFATPAALIAMKLHAIEDRRATSGQDKRAGDAWDMYRLLVDLDADGTVRTALAAAPPRLRSLVREAAERVFVVDATRTRGWLRSGDDSMGAVSAEDLRAVGQPLVAALG